MSEMDKFDIEANEDDGGLVVNPAFTATLEPPAATIPAPAAHEEVRRSPGRPRKLTAVASPIAAPVPAPKADLARKEDEWPKDIPGLWMRVLEEGRANGRGADEFLIWVFQTRSSTAGEIRMPDPIVGDRVAGALEGKSGGEALVELLTDVYHMPTTTEAAQYKIEVCLRATGAKIRKSEFWPLDRPEKIERIRAQSRRRDLDQSPSGDFYRQYVPSPSSSPHYPYPPPSRNDPSGGAAPAAAAAAAVAPAPQAPPPTGNDYVDRFIADLQQREYETRQREEASRRREEEARRGIDELRAEIRALTAPPPPVVESDEVKQAKLAASIAQAVTQTLIASGFAPAAHAPMPVASTAAPAPAITPAQQQAAVVAQRTSSGALEDLVLEIERLDKLKGRMRKVLGVPEEEEEDETVHAAIPEPPLEKPLRSYKMGPLTIPRFDEEDEMTVVEKALAFFGANPAISKEIAGQVMGAVMSKVSPGMLQQVLGAAMAQGGGAAAAAAGIRSAVNGAAGGFTPPGA